MNVMIFLYLPHCAKFSYKERYGCPWMGTPWHPKDSLIVLLKNVLLAQKKSHPKRNFDSAGKGMQKCSTGFVIYYVNMSITQHNTRMWQLAFL